jgi:hypothetical protein
MIVDISRQRMRRIIANAALQLKRDAGDLRGEGMEFLIAAREWLRLNKPFHAEVAVMNAISVLRPLWKTERFISSRR